MTGKVSSFLCQWRIWSLLKKNMVCHSECLLPYCLQEKTKHWEVKLLAFPGLSHIGCRYLWSRQGCAWSMHTPNSSGGLRSHSQTCLGSLAARGGGPTYCGMEFLFPIGMKQSDILKRSHNLNCFESKSSFLSDLSDSSWMNYLSLCGANGFWEQAFSAPLPYICIYVYVCTCVHIKCIFFFIII